jgi:polysaccharide pyruvyl transferase WcaK-like protein
MSATRPIRILVEPSDYVLRNVGDMAMMHVATERLAQLWPDAAIEVLTDVPEPLSILCPTATPLRAHGRNLWLQPDFLPGKLQRRLPEPWPEAIRAKAPRALNLFWRLKLRQHPEKADAIARFVRSVDEADLVLVSGMGGITDYFPNYARRLLEAMNLALAGKKRPVVMVGQGMGPLNDAELRARAAAILPRVDLIALREKRASAPLLKALGVPAERVATTGDDAIEMAHEGRLDELGNGIGINLRLADYSGVSSGALRHLRQVFAAMSERLGAPLVALPVSRVPGEEDMNTIRQLMPDDSAELERGFAVHTPQDLIQQVQRCRVVITGSYHAGVFALANGIPTVGLAQSAYYVDKFLGLADMFGTGCEPVNLDRPDFSERLESIIQRFWAEAPSTRPAILASAQKQIEAGHKVYQRIYDLVMAYRRGAADA